jgi:hypothetical protein
MRRNLGCYFGLSEVVARTAAILIDVALDPFFNCSFLFLELSFTRF